MRRKLINSVKSLRMLARGSEAALRDSRKSIRRAMIDFEPVEARRMFAVTATFAPATGILSVTGDALDNSITVSRNAAGTLLVNGGAVAVAGGVPSVANTTLIQMFGLAGADNLVLDETNGAVPASQIQGGTENDTIVGGSGGDNLFGDAGNDAILGKAGFDFLFGNDGNDTLTGGDDDDQCFGLADNDRFVWNPGDDTDLNEGDIGSDTVEVNGGGSAEVFTTTANGTRVRFDRIDPAPFALDIGTCEKLVLIANGGNDSFSNTGNLSALISINADGGAGNDTLLGSNGIDTLLGGDGADFIDGQQGNDVVFLGAQDDVFQWDPGDGSDVVEGEDGVDKLMFNGSAGSEIIEASANGQRVRFTRNLGTIVMDLNDVEKIDHFAGGGTDSIIVGDMSGTDLTEININLSSVIGGSTADLAADLVTVNGTNAANDIDVVGAGTSYSVVGLQTRVNVATSEGALDALVVNALGGDDQITATTLPSGVVTLTADGGIDADTLLGSQGADLFLGGDGDDSIFGDNGNDNAFMGAGNDVFQWNPGDGNDTVEGQADTDTMLFNGANVPENVDIVANGGRILFLRNVATVTMDLDGVETITFNALGGTDNVVVGDLSGTDAATINLDLAGTIGGDTGDSAADSVTVSATNGADSFGVVDSGANASTFGLQAAVNIFSPEAANDRLTLNALGDADVIDASSLPAGIIQTTFNGGLGVDQIIGSDGDDLINGGDGNDSILAGAGNDTFTWNPGDDNDTFEGQVGFDTLQFNAAVIAEQIVMSAVGGRMILTRDIALVTMDTDGVEQVNLPVVGGADTITLNSLTGTDVTNININLATGGIGDSAVDTININGGPAADTMNVAGSTAGITVTGLSATINVSGVEAANEQFYFRGLGGSDTVAFGSVTGLDGLKALVNLEAAVNGAIADGNADLVALDFNNSVNTIGVTDSGAASVVTGGPIALTVATGDTTDSLRLNAQGGNDSININQAGNAGAMKRVVIDTGSELDTITVVNTGADGSATILPSTGDDNIGVNVDGLFAANAVFQGTQRIGALTIGTNGKATIAASGTTVLTSSALSVSGTGRMDLTNNAMVIDYPLISPISTIQSLATAGYNGGAWNGNGITSSTAASTPNRGVGFAQAADVFSAFPANFAGQSVDSTSVLLRFTLTGDANLDRSVNIGDFSIVAANFNVASTRWSRGNFNFNGSTDLGDFSSLAANFNQSIPGDLPRAASTFGTTQIGQIDREEITALVG